MQQQHVLLLVAVLIATVCACRHEATCEHGNWTCAPNHCVCENNWGGTNCSICTDDAGCGSGYECSQNMWAYSDKSFQCKITEGSLKSILANGWVDFRCAVNNTEGANNCTLAIWDNNIGPPMALGCDMTECSRELTSYHNVTYTCDSTACYCGPYFDCTFFQKMIDDMTGEMSITCNVDSGVCSFIQPSVPLDLTLGCTAGECLSSHGNHVIPPFIPPPVDATTGNGKHHDDKHNFVDSLTKQQRLVVTIAGGALVVVLIVSAIALLKFRGKQFRASEFERMIFEESLIGDDDGAGDMMIEGGEWTINSRGRTVSGGSDLSGILDDDDDDAAVLTQPSSYRKDGSVETADGQIVDPVSVPVLAPPPPSPAQASKPDRGGGDDDDNEKVDLLSGL